MLKTTLITVILLLNTLYVFPQTRISVATNPQFIWLSSKNNNVENEGLMMGANTGLHIDFFFAEKYAFSIGLTLDHLGGRIRYQDEVGFNLSGTSYQVGAGAEMKQRLRYLGVPLGLKLKTQEIGYSTFYINPGFTPMVNLKSVAQGGNIPPKTDFSDETKLLNLNYFISGGAEYSLGGSTAVFGGLGYSAGLMDIASHPDFVINTRSLFFTLGILF